MPKLLHNKTRKELKQRQEHLIKSGKLFQATVNALSPFLTNL